MSGQWGLRREGSDALAGTPEELPTSFRLPSMGALGSIDWSQWCLASVADRSADWIQQALRDLEQAEESMESGRHEWACFAAHQAVEKALKGMNLALGQQAWGHTLTRLWAALPPLDWHPAPPAELQDRLRLLDGFYIPTRYPDSYPEGTPGEHFGRLQSEQALLHAGVILTWIRAVLAERR